MPDEVLSQQEVESLLSALRTELADGDSVLFMSNGSFDNAPRRLLVMA